MCNDWFTRFAPEAYRTTRVRVIRDVEETLKATKNLKDVGLDPLKANPSLLPSLRMCACPTLSVDRLIGLTGVSGHLVRVMERGKRLPARMTRRELEHDLGKIAFLIR